jgi:hypothetical protein
MVETDHKYKILGSCTTDEIKCSACSTVSVYFPCIKFVNFFLILIFFFFSPFSFFGNKLAKMKKLNSKQSLAHDLYALESEPNILGWNYN